MANKSGKGSDFERLVATQLSRWWTNDARDDIFWRTAGSGARATTRSKGGKRTAQQYGDICAIDPLGNPFVDLITLELKRGYNTRSIHDLLDYSPTQAVTEWEGFLEKAIKSHEQAGSAFWMIITRRDRHTAWVWFPWDMVLHLRVKGIFPNGPPEPHASFAVYVRAKGRGPAPGAVRVFGTTLDNFLAHVTPEAIRILAREL
jgi:hypothetical protein